MFSIKGLKVNDGAEGILLMQPPKLIVAIMDFLDKAGNVIYTTRGIAVKMGVTPERLHHICPAWTGLDPYRHFHKNRLLWGNPKTIAKLKAYEKRHNQP